MARTEKTIRRHKKVSDYYDKLYGKKVTIGKKKVRYHSEAYCLAKTAEDLDYEESYVRRILNGWFP